MTDLDLGTVQRATAKLEAALEQLQLIRFGDISAVGYGQVLDARCLLAEALGRLDSVRKQPLLRTAGK